MKGPFRYRIHGVALGPNDRIDPIDKALRDWRIPGEAVLEAKITRESLDARKANHPVRKFTLELLLKRPFERRMMEPLGEPAPDPDDPFRATLRLPGQVHVVGSGPCGIAGAIALAEKGYRVVLHERGGDLVERSRLARRFLKEGSLDPETNFLFGEGGAGTFTDGKLTTRTRGRLIQDALKQWVDCGEEPSIQWRAKPHLGTDRMRVLVAAMRRRFVEAGGEVRFLSRLDDIELHQGRLVRASFNGKWEPIEGLALAIGHSARDTWDMLFQRGVPFEAKEFAMGVRVEHPQALIDRNQYGPRVDPKSLGAAEYFLSCSRPPEGVAAAHSFCMCPGGEVLPTTTSDQELATNGMSFRARGSRWANAGMVVPIHREALSAWCAEAGVPDDVWAGVRLQRFLERRAMAMGGGAFRAPAQRCGDFLSGRVSSDLPDSSYVRGLAPCELHDLFPSFMTRALEVALLDFDRKIPGFVEHGLMLAPETRTSSPVRVPRAPETLSPPGCEGLFALGEGAGWSGGIVTSAADGIRLADRAVGAKGR